MKSPTTATLKRLFSVSGNRCAFPGCHTSLVDSPTDKVTGKVCHIKARRSRGARHDPHLSMEELHGFNNLILLCAMHHDVVDADHITYTVERLQRMKAEHEEKYKNGPRPSDRIVNSLQQADSELKLVELRRPPDEILDLLKSKYVRRLSKTSKFMIAGAIFYFVWFCFDLWFISKVGLDHSSVWDMLPSPAFLLLAVGLTHLSYVHYRRKLMVESEPPLMASERYQVRDLTLEADYDHLVNRCVEALRTTGAKIFEVAKEGADHTIICALKERGNFWSRFTTRGNSLDEIIVSILREEGGKCLIKVETTIGEKPDGSMVYISKFLDRMIR